MPWAVVSLQIVWFKTDVGTINARDVFQAALGSEPDSYQSNRNVTPAAPFLSLATTAKDAVLDRVQVGPGRIDLVRSAEPSQDQPFNTLAIDPSEAMAAMVPIFERGSHVAGATTRIALVTNLSRTTDSVEAAAQIAGGFFGTNVPSGALDANFQLSRRLNLKSQNQPINRLLRMNSVSVQGFAISGPTFENIPTSVLAYACQYMIDVNLVPTGAEFDAAEQLIMFGEMVEEARRILASEGISEALR